MSDKISPCLWFDGKAEEAARFYVSLVPDSRIETIVPYSMDMPGGKAGDAMMVQFTLAGRTYLALNGGPMFQFSPAISFAIDCAEQAEVDRLWDALTAGGAPGRCGWLTDRYGVSWQVVPSEMVALVKKGDGAAIQRMTQAMMQMGKLDIAVLRRAYAGEAG